MDECVEDGTDVGTLLGDSDGLVGQCVNTEVGIDEGTIEGLVGWL
jgi:hypothetical protein